MTLAVPLVLGEQAYEWPLTDLGLVCLGVFFGGHWLPFLCVLNNRPKVDFRTNSNTLISPIR